MSSFLMDCSYGSPTHHGIILSARAFISRRLSVPIDREYVFLFLFQAIQVTFIELFWIRTILDTKPKNRTGL